MESPQSVSDLILDAVDTLTPAEKRVGQAVLASFPSSGLRSASALAKEAGASPATVVRFLSKLGFGGLGEFQEAVRRDLDRRLRSPFELYSPAEDARAPFLEAILKYELTIVAETLGRLDEQVLAEVRRLLTASSAVWVMGGRFSQSLAHYLYAHLNLFRPDVRLLNDAHTSIPDQVVHARRGVCLVVFDFRRYQADAEFAARAVKSRRGRVIVVTDPYLSPASHHADRTLVVSTERPTLLDSHTGATALVDVIVSDLLAHDHDAISARLAEVERSRATLARAAPDEYT